MKNSIVITSINPKTKGIKEFERLLVNWKIIIVGDKKSPLIENTDTLTFLSVQDQLNTKFKLLDYLPFNHYVRKNIGYLYALKHGAINIYDTDDDNLPYKDWAFPSFELEKRKTIRSCCLFNVYSAFTNELIWPRGFPLDNIQQPEIYKTDQISNKIAVWQGLADLDPDVDAIHRLVFNKEIHFEKKPPVVLEKGTYCPFNSQNTLWHQEMLPYAYLPATVTFRFTDILRGYIAQRCFWEHDKVLGFTKATVYQERNQHDLMKDFESELSCYINIKKIINILDNLTLKQDYAYNLIAIYSELAKQKIVDHKELVLVKAWLNDIEKLL